MIAVSPATHYELYHNWESSLAFCRALPDIGPAGPTTFHMFWRERRGRFWPKRRRFGRRQALPVKAFFATQDLSKCSLVLWSDQDISQSEWLRPFRAHITFRIYEPEVEVRGTPLEPHWKIYRQRDARAYRDSDLFRILALHNYGGVYVDMDMVLLRSLGVFLDQEFVYQWDRYDGLCCNALMSLRVGSEFARELIRGVIEIPAGKYNWGRENLRRAIDQGRRITVFPSPFFDTDWQANDKFEPFRKTGAATNFFEGAFAWHWHNRWDEPIEKGSKFQLLEARVDDLLRVRLKPDTTYKPAPDTTHKPAPDTAYKPTPDTAAAQAELSLRGDT